MREFKANLTILSKEQKTQEKRAIWFLMDGGPGEQQGKICPMKERITNQALEKDLLAYPKQIKSSRIYIIKEEFRDIFESENKKAAKEALDNFVNKFGDDYPFLKKMVKTNESEILNRFTDDGKRDIKHWPEQLIEKLRKFERRRGAFRTFESWEMLIDLLLEHSCGEN
ncbi:hypothetical protein BEH94_02560 [Candidatus Altiarchaeales archaeon WOR_SM1_SCG]|nr:hypothetical protein BEH94_02560 [Candidatus Altiarchaeales archaeon WOR_SM1_SCG]